MKTFRRRLYVIVIAPVALVVLLAEEAVEAFAFFYRNVRTQLRRYCLVVGSHWAGIPIDDHVL